jgi:hypothetical protein
LNEEEKGDSEKDSVIPESFYYEEDANFYPGP